MFFYYRVGCIALEQRAGRDIVVTKLKCWGGFHILKIRSTGKFGEKPSRMTHNCLRGHETCFALEV